MQAWLQRSVMIGLLAMSSTTLAATWDGGHGSAEAACRARLDESAISYAGTKALDSRNVHCMCKDKGGKGDAWYCNTVSQDVTDEPQAKTADDAASGGATAANCNYKFNESAAPQGNHPETNLLCGKVSADSPSYLVYPIRKDGKLGSQLTEVDALRGNTWYECKCGYVPTIKAYNQEKPWAIEAITGPSGTDKTVNTQRKIAEECGYDYNLVVANSQVEDFFRDRYPTVKVIREDFEPCE